MRGAAAERPDGPARQRHHGDGEEGGLGHEQTERGRPEAVERGEDGDQRMEVVAEQMEAVAAQRDDGSLEPGVGGRRRA
ncbi:hypothetical protein SCWH03_20870 [Streptomyces pacificus]|uniref:Uncharacterized protein n=1 Tax=Streptomyces pacificus TaxID=2705029 RepID=A0A6A0ATS6_9ACTN|nr:hypothetical protein SCWH03_20870 [Streptomyces pacificus]